LTLRGKDINVIRNDIPGLGRPMREVSRHERFGITGSEEVLSWPKDVVEEAVTRHLQVNFALAPEQGDDGRSQSLPRKSVSG
jgi:hypothetical protein